MGRCAVLKRAPTATQDKAAQIDPKALPRHIAVIMDGNGRWAKERGLLRTAGHRAGVESLRSVIYECGDLGVPMLTVFAFSTENWRRPRKEVHFLMHLLEEVLEREFRKLHENGVRIRILGHRDKLNPSILRRIEAAEKRTAANEKLALNVAWNYGGRADITFAARKLAQRVASGDLDPEAIDEDVFSQHLHTSEMPDPDLLIRTGGEYRLSNFLLWQLAYAELWVTPTFWPDFRPNDLHDAILDFQCRDRRFGRL